MAHIIQKEQYFLYYWLSFYFISEWDQYQL